MKRITEAAQKTVEEDKNLRDVARKIGQGFIDEDKSLNAVVQKYNDLVNMYNSLLSEHRTVLQEDIGLLDRLQAELRSANYNCQLANFRTLLNSIPSRTQVIYKPPTRLNCTTQNMSAAAPGLAAWSYTSCY
jgi:ABC-type transporter Mla subunit MlaD